MTREQLQQYLHDLRAEAGLNESYQKSDSPLVIPAADHIGARKKSSMNGHTKFMIVGSLVAIAINCLTLYERDYVDKGIHDAVREEYLFNYFNHSNEHHVKPLTYRLTISDEFYSNSGTPKSNYQLRQRPIDQRRHIRQKIFRG